MEARSQLTERRFASAHLSLVEAENFREDVWDETFELSGGGWTGPEGTNWVAASAGVAEAGVVVEVATPAGIDYPLEVADLDDPARILSDDTLGFAAATFDPNVDHRRAGQRRYEIGGFLGPDGIDGLREIVDAISNEFGSIGAVRLDEDDGLEVLLDLGLSITSVITEIDLEDDLFDHLDGEIIAAIGDVDFDGSLETMETNAFDAVVTVSYLDGRKDDPADTIDDAEERFAALAELNTGTPDVGGDDRAVAFDLEGLIDAVVDYRPGYVLHEGYLALGSAERALEGSWIVRTARPTVCRRTRNTSGHRDWCLKHASSWDMR